MADIVKIYYLSGVIFKEIVYVDLNNLKEKLNKLLDKYNKDSFIQLLLNETIINEGNQMNNFNFYKVNNLNRVLEDNEIIQAIIVSKISLFFYTNEKSNEIILNTKYKHDNYYMLIKRIAKVNDIYNIVNTMSYKDLVIYSVLQDPNNLQYANNSMKDDKDVALTAINTSLSTGGLRFVSKRLQDTKEIVLIAVQQKGLSLYYTNDKLKNNKEIVSYAVEQNGLSLHFASINMRIDKDVVMKAVKQNGTALKYARIKMRKDKEIVLHAVKQDGLSLEYASINLQNDKEIVLYAVNQNGLALKYASYSLKNDRDVVLAAIKKNYRAILLASNDLKNDVEFKLVINKINLELNNRYN